MTKEIKLGDIAVFEAENDWISKSIALLTNSEVSHAALVHKDMTFAEMGLSGIQSNKFMVDEEKGRKVYFLRMKPEVNPAPVLKFAQKYIDDKVAYDKPSLYLLSGILVYRMIRNPNAKLSKTIDLILNAAVLIIDKMINKAKKNGTVMVCSQLVYQCYYDAGKDYYIKIKKGGNFQAVSPSSICLADMALEEDALLDTAATPQNNDLSTINIDSLTKELYEALSESSENDRSFLTSPIFKKTLSSTKKFIDKMEELKKVLSLDMPISALFVTPSDFLSNSENLELIETVKISRTN